MNILDKIIAHKIEEVTARKASYSIASLEKSHYFNAPTVSLKDFLLRPDQSGIIAEFKRHSPSQGDINTHSSVAVVTRGYASAGASGLSVLTDERFFKGKNEDLTEARQFNEIPILRKDFVIDEYQILEAKSIGASAILLIAACLSQRKLGELATFAKSLGLDVLMEVHSEEELKKLHQNIDIVGVNNRDLTTFEVNLKTSIDLFDVIPNNFVKISESGISHPQSIIQLKEVGFQGFLIGEAFMKTENPMKSCQAFIREIMNVSV